MQGLVASIHALRLAYDNRLVSAKAFSPPDILLLRMLLIIDERLFSAPGPGSRNGKL
jgi:hypothetical protein